MSNVKGITKYELVVLIEKNSFFTVGVGNVIGGEVYGYHGKFFKQGGVTYVTLTQNTELDSISGTTSFVNFGYEFGPVDLLIGYRKWNVKYKTKYTKSVTYLGDTTSSSGKNTGENEIQSVQLPLVSVSKPELFINLLQ